MNIVEIEPRALFARKIAFYGSNAEKVWCEWHEYTAFLSIGIIGHNIAYSRIGNNYWERV